MTSAAELAETTRNLEAADSGLVAGAADSPEFSFVTNEDISKARSYIMQLKIKIEVACSGTDLQACQDLLEEAEDLQAGQVNMIGEELITRLELHAESLSIGTRSLRPIERNSESTELAPEPESVRLPPPPAHIAMKTLKNTLKRLTKALDSARGFAESVHQRHAEAEQQREAVAARVEQVLDILEHTLEERMDLDAHRLLSLAAARAMAELMIHGFANPAADKDGDAFHPACGSRLSGSTFRRVSLIVARLDLEPSVDPYEMYSAAWGSGRLEALWNSEENVVAQALIGTQKLSAEDALNYACLCAADCRVPGDWTKRARAIGLTTADFAKLYVNTEPMVSQKKTTSDHIPTQMVGLLLKLIRSGEIPECAVRGAWKGVLNCVFGRPAVGSYAFECGVFELIVDCLRAIGGPLDWLTYEKRTDGDGRVIWATQVAATILRAELSQVYKADASFQRSGLIQEYIAAVSKLDALRRKQRNVEKLTVNTGTTSALSAVTPMRPASTDQTAVPYSPALYFILSVLSDHSHDAEVDKLLKVVRLAKEFAADAAYTSELQRQYQQMLEDARSESTRQAAVRRAKSLQTQARRSWDVSEDVRRNVDKAVKCYNHALALDPNNKELRKKVRETDAARYAAKQKWRRRIAKSAVKANLDLCPRLGTATIYRPTVVRDSKVDRAIKAEIRVGSGHHVPGYIAPQHGWPETSRQPLRGSFEKAPRV